MKTAPLSIAATLLLLLSVSSPLNAQNGNATAPSAPAALEYKMISGYKQPFTADLKQKTANGWKPVGGVSVTSWNNDLFFAQLLSRPVGSGQ